MSFRVDDLRAGDVLVRGSEITRRTDFDDAVRESC